MTAISRYVKMTAREGSGEALAQRMLEVADGLRSTTGCELYVINRSRAVPDVVWVTELWASQEALEAAPDGLEVLVFGPHHAGDGDLSTEFWPAGAPDGEQS